MTKLKDLRPQDLESDCVQAIVENLDEVHLLFIVWYCKSDAQCSQWALLHLKVICTNELFGAYKLFADILNVSPSHATFKGLSHS